MMAKVVREAPPRQRDFLEKIMTEKLDSIKFTDLVTAEASGPSMVPTADGQTRVGWMLVIWLAHNRLIGQGPIGLAVPVAVLDPPVEMVKMITEKLLDEARKIRQRANEPPATPDAAEMMEAIRRRNGQGPPT